MSENLCLMASTSSLWCYFSSSFCFVNFSSSLAEEERSRRGRASFSAYQTLPFVFFLLLGSLRKYFFLILSRYRKKSSHRRRRVLDVVQHSLVTHETWEEALSWRVAKVVKQCVNFPFFVVKLCDYFHAQLVRIHLYLRSTVIIYLSWILAGEPLPHFKTNLAIFQQRNFWRFSDCHNFKWKRKKSFNAHKAEIDVAKV